MIMRRSGKYALFTGTLVCLTFLILAPGAGLAAGVAETDDKTLSPYFFVKSDDPATDRLPLKSTRADVKIAGVIADVTITQTYKNEGRNTLEAVYVFPGSTRAAVYAMRMTVGKRVIEAEIMKRAEARATYEQAKREGKTASLLEQQRPNVFQMNVANILPGDEIKVEMKYTELIVPEETVYEFVYPAVVGPRYTETPAADAPDTEKYTQTPYLHSGEAAPYDFGLTLDLKSGIPIADLNSPSHKAHVEYSGKTRAIVSLGDDPKAGTKDFVLRYRLAGGRIQTGLMLYPGRDENFFLMMMEPPARVASRSILPREYIFIVDVSGSMNGFPLTQVAKPLMREMIGALRPNDFMNVLLFAGGSAVLSENRSLPASPANKRKAVAWIDSQRGGGGTRILPALRRALDLPRTEGVSRIIVVVTDGYVSVEPQVFDLIRKNLGRANLFAFGIGKSVNRHLIEGMARSGMGEPFIVLNPSEGRKQAARFRKYIEAPVLTDIGVRFDGLKAYDVEPIAVPDLFAHRPVVLFGKYRGNPGGTITVTGHTASGEFRNEVAVNAGSASTDNAALRLLWARHRIMRLADLSRLTRDSGRIEEVTALGLKYSLMTQYTSFVAVDKVRRADGKLVTVKQPLPLPEGVSDHAVGANGRGIALKTKAMAPPPAGGYAAGTAGPQTPSTLAPRPVKEAEESGAHDRKPDAESADEFKGRSVVIRVESVRGGLNAADAAKALRSRQRFLEECYQKAVSRRKKALDGEVVFRLVVDATGRVKAVRTTSSTIADAPTELCLKTALKATRFPSLGQGEAEVVVKVICRAVS